MLWHGGFISKGVNQLVGNWDNYLILLAIDLLNGERSLPAVIHLLRGRKNHQVIQDCSLFGTSLLFGELHKYSVHQLHDYIIKLKSDGMIQNSLEPFIFCTEKGKKILDQWKDEHRIYACLEAFPTPGHKVVTAHFWYRLELMVQTLSHVIQGEWNFYPIIVKEEIKEEVKAIFFQEKDFAKQARQLKNELYAWMQQLTDWEQKIILLRLSGKGKAGLTFAQIGELLGKPEEWVKLQLLRLAGEKYTSLNSAATPMLYRIACLQKVMKGLSQSAQKTYDLLKQGKNIDAIASQRRLRIGTVEDHIVEIALADPTFDISPFVDKEKEKKIVQMIHTYGTRKLGKLKRLAGEDVSYLELRLVCGREAVNRKTWKKNR